LTSYEVEKYFRALKDAGVGRTTIRYIRALLHRACKLAGKWSGGRLPNPVASTEMPTWTLSEQSDRVRAPSLEEIGRLLSAAQEFDPRIHVILRLIVATGARRGEACAIRWSDCDLDAGVAQIDESIIPDKGATTKSPKTRASIRKVTIDQGTLSELHKPKAIQAQLARDLGYTICEDSFVFSFEPGGEQSPHPDSITHAFTKVPKLSGLATDIHLHSLRHFQATAALDAVVSEQQKQSRLGWSSTVMARRYTDAVPEEDRRAAEHMGSLLEAVLCTEADRSQPQAGQVSVSGGP
jgi:integrase